MLTAPTFAAALVSGLRTHGDSPAGASGRRWSALADDARTLALGLVEAGVRPGAAIRVRLGDGAAPEDVVAAEVAVLAAGAALAVDDTVGADREIGGAEMTDLRAAGAALDRHRPAAHEERLAAVEPGDVALLGDGLVVTHAQALWAVRSVAAWLGPAVPDGPGVVAAPAPGHEPTAGPVAAALVGRWWPATAGATLVTGELGGESARNLSPSPPSSGARRARVVVGDGAMWDGLVGAVRDEAGRSRAGTALLRRGRALVAGEVTGRWGRAGRTVAERRAGERLRRATGLDALALGVCLGPLGVATGRDLEAAGIPVVATWIDPAVPAPIASGSRARPAPAEPWGRPLPGRTVEVGPPVVVHGGDVATAGVATPVATEVDHRGRLRLPAVRGAA